MYEKVTKEELMQEAMERLKILQNYPQYKIHPNVLRDFENGKLNYSDRGILYWLTDEYQAMVTKIEQEYGLMVYFAIYNNTDMGELLCCLVVSSSKQHWETERNCLAEGYPFCYIKNITDESCSEFGDTPMRGVLGGLIRTDIIYN